jgi:hypothetical protein
MERRLAAVLEIPAEGAWQAAFDEDEKMTGRQDKYQHMLDRTFLRPRDMIKFTNEVLAAYKKHRMNGESLEYPRFRNKDVQAARNEYSSYLLSEIDDEIPKHYPDYQKYIEILKSMESLQFRVEDFEVACERRKAFLPIDATPQAILMALFQFSLIGYYAPGGGTGGLSMSTNTKIRRRSLMKQLQSTAYMLVSKRFSGSRIGLGLILDRQL